jgi:hypothetical protein
MSLDMTVPSHIDGDLGMDEGFGITVSSAFNHFKFSPFKEMADLRHLSIKSIEGNQLHENPHNGESTFVSEHLALLFYASESKPLDSLLNHNPKLDHLSLNTCLMDALACLLQSTQKPIAETSRSVAAANLSTLALGGSVIQQMRTSRDVGVRIKVEGEQHPVERSTDEREQMCAVAFSGLHKAKEIVVTTDTGFLQQEPTTRAIGDFSHPYMRVLELIARAPAIETLHFPLVRMGHNHLDPNNPCEFAEILPDRFADESAAMLSTHRKLLNLKIGGIEYTRASAEPRGNPFERLQGASYPGAHADEKG